VKRSQKEGMEDFSQKEEMEDFFAEQPRRCRPLESVGGKAMARGGGPTATRNTYTAVQIFGQSIKSI
jgi:hypothetical protein